MKPTVAFIRKLILSNRNVLWLSSESMSAQDLGAPSSNWVKAEHPAAAS